MANVPEWDTLRKMNHADLVTAFNQARRRTEGGADYWRNELFLRELASTNRILLWLTAVILLATIVNVWLVYKTVG